MNDKSPNTPHQCPQCGKEHLPTPTPTYEFIKSIGKGGMGEVSLVYDPVCKRQIALKKIRADLLEHPQIRKRFLKEAHLTCQLIHPAIIPIFSIDSSHQAASYTMPYVEGETLKELIKQTHRQEKRGEKINTLGGSIPALMRVFTSICQAVAYAHSRHVLHRDLKPENIIVGKYGQVLILDWGLAKLITPQAEKESDELAPAIFKEGGDITRIGKVVGTISYMAPERALGQPATIQTDIYSLGVILYQLLTLKSPFRRGTLEEFRKNMAKEELVDPIIAAPYRDVPRILARCAKKCLDIDPSERYQSVDELIYDLENYLEGRSGWFQVTQLDIERKNDWEFQENILIAEHTAVTRASEESEWVSLMISKQSFSGNTKLEARVCLGEQGHGIGFLLSIPEAGQRNYLNEGYCLWLGSDRHRSTKLLRSNVEVIQAPDIYLKRQQWYTIRVEKIEKSIHLYINNTLQFSYLAHLPLIGTHIGVLSRDADFEMKPLDISVGNLNITVNCLAVPDAFLAHRDYDQALSEYRRIAYSFPDRVEGREAIFRAGMTLLEKAKKHAERQTFLNQALDEFQKLHSTPGAPLGYLGKALVYCAFGEDEEEIKCYELAYRRYPKHPLLPVLQEQIVSRMHEVSRLQRLNTYRFILLVVRHLPSEALDTHTKRLFSGLQRHWEPLPFLEPEQNSAADPLAIRLAMSIAFWLDKPFMIEEILMESAFLEEPAVATVKNGLFCLIQLGASKLAREVLHRLPEHLSLGSGLSCQWFQGALAYGTDDIHEIFYQYFCHPCKGIEPEELRSIFYFMDKALDAQHPHLVQACADILSNCKLSHESKLKLDIRVISSMLMEDKWTEAADLFYSYPVEILNSDSSLLHFLYGCWLQATEGVEMANLHFVGIITTLHPRSWMLGSYEIMGQLSEEWLERAFHWEKIALYRQLSLYWHCAGHQEKQQFFLMKLNEEFSLAENEFSA